MLPFILPINLSRTRMRAGLRDVARSRPLGDIVPKTLRIFPKVFTWRWSLSTPWCPSRTALTFKIIRLAKLDNDVWCMMLCYMTTQEQTFNDFHDILPGRMSHLMVKSPFLMVKSASSHLVSSAPRLCTFRVFGGDVTTALHKSTKFSVASSDAKGCQLTTIQKGTQSSKAVIGPLVCDPPAKLSEVRCNCKTSLSSCCTCCKLVPSFPG